MNLLRRILAFFALFGASPAPHAQTPARPGPGLREMFLNITAAKAGVIPSPQFPHVFGVALDWPIGEHIATVISLYNGSASLYTTSTFGVIGGGGNEAVRPVAKQFVSSAERYLAESAPTSSHPYPPLNKVRFYLLTYEGVRLIEADAERVYSGSDRFSPLFGAAQEVVTQLRLATEKK